jgi:hypothetical protein
MLFADRNAAINQWLEDHPAVLGLGAVALGLVLLGLGIAALKTGRAPTKRGRDLEGNQARAMAFVWLTIGGLCVLFGLFKIAVGLL